MSTARQRARDRADRIPAMEGGDRHEPMDWFAEVGFRRVLEMAGGAGEPVDDWSLDGAGEQARDEYLEARKSDHRRVADWLRAAKIAPLNAEGEGVIVGDYAVGWPDRLPLLIVWSGNQTLARLLRARQRQIGSDLTDDVLDCTAPMPSASGIDRGLAADPIDIGFSPAAVGVQLATRIVAEMLAVIGLEEIPLTVWPDRSISYRIAGQGEYRFRRERRGDYGYGRWSQAERIRDCD